jgi:hypothetical protein
MKYRYEGCGVRGGGLGEEDAHFPVRGKTPGEGLVVAAGEEGSALLHAEEGP